MGKYDTAIIALVAEGKGGHLIANELKLNKGYVGRRLKQLGLQKPVGSNQSGMLPGALDVKFSSVQTNLNREAELYFEYLCIKCGFQCTVPNVSVGYDYLVDFGDGWKKIQVKSSANCTFSLARTRHNSTTSKIVFYSSEEVDYFFLYNKNQRCWLIPHRLVHARRVIKTNQRAELFEIH